MAVSDTRPMPAGYVQAGTSDELEQRYDAATFRRLSEFGDLTGLRALEAGAGAGSVARWLGQRVGSTGSVLALDLDPRFLTDHQGENVEVRRHDIETDPLPAESVDLAHCRAVLFHLAEPARALGFMVTALRPGGRILVEDADAVTLVAADPTHPAARVFDRVNAAIFRRADDGGNFNCGFGRGLVALARRSGLAGVRHEANVALRYGASAEAEFMARSCARLLPALRAEGALTASDVAAFDGALRDPTFAYYDMLSVAVWARKP